MWERKSPELAQRVGRMMAERQIVKLQEQRELFRPHRQAGEGSAEKTTLGDKLSNSEGILKK